MKKVSPKKPAFKDSTRRRNRFNKIILDNVPVSIITIDKNGDITSVNKYFKNFSSQSDYKNKNIFSSEFFIRENLVENYKKLLSSGAAFRRDDCHQVNSRGEDKYSRITAFPFRDEKGRIDGAVSLASDNTEAVKFKKELIKLNSSLEDKVKQRTEELGKANKELSKVLELKTFFMADVSHEFRTSLTIMQCSLDLLAKSGKPTSENDELFDNVMTEIKRTSNMLADLSLLTKSSSSELKLNFEKVNLNSSIVGVCKALEVLAREKNVKIEYNKKTPPVEILASKENIEKLLLNLIRNAIKYNKDGGWIKVSVEKEKSGVCIKVEDNGIGIPENEIENIFERFYRVNKDETRNSENSGLGLAICKYVAEAHGGKISVKNKPEEGSLFTVYLPFNPKKIHEKKV